MVLYPTIIRYLLAG